MRDTKTHASQSVEPTIDPTRREVLQGMISGGAFLLSNAIPGRNYADIAPKSDGVVIQDSKRWGGPSTPTSKGSRLRTYPYRAKVLFDDYRGTYNRFVTKEDVVWIDDYLHVTEPIESNGGDVILFGDTIRVDAPIDTRVRIETYGPFWEIEPHPTQYQLAAINDFDVAVARVNAWKAFNDLRFWEDRFDAQQRMYIYQGRADYGESWRAYPALKNPGFPIANFQLPSGRIPYLRNEDPQQIGADAPIEIVDRDATRSGNIYIFARSLSVCPDIELPDWRQSLLGDVFDFDRPIFFQAGGLKGGRGGSGYINAVHMDGSYPNGLCGAPGRGGDGGSVYFYFINDFGHRAERETEAITRAATLRARLIERKFPGPLPTPPEWRLTPSIAGSLAWLSNIDGGYPPYLRSRFRVKPTNLLVGASTRKQIEQIETGHLSDDSSLALFRGKSGQVEFKSVRFDEALSLLALNLDSLDIRTPGKVALLLQTGSQFAAVASEARATPPTTSADVDRRNRMFKQLLGLRLDSASAVDLQLTARGELVSYLETELVRSEKRFLAAALGEDAGAQCMTAELATDELQGRPGLSDIERVLLSAISGFRSVDAFNPVHSYFLNTGGVYLRPSAEDLRGINYVSQSNGLLNELNRSVMALLDQQILQREQSLEFWRKYFDADYLHRISELKEKIDALRKTIERGANIVIAGADTLASASHYLQQSIESYQKQQFFEAAEGIAHVGETIFSFFSQSQPTVTGLERDLSRLVEEFHRFTLATNTAVQEMVLQRSASLQKAFTQNDDYRSQRRLDWLRFEHVIRGAFQNYIEKPQQARIFFNNLRGIRSAIDSPSAALPIELTPTFSTCRDESEAADLLSLLVRERAQRPIGCVHFDAAHGKVLVLRGRNGILEALPLISTGGLFSLPLSIKGGDVELIEMPSKTSITAN